MIFVLVSFDLISSDLILIPSRILNVDKGRSGVLYICIITMEFINISDINCKSNIFMVEY